MEGASKKSRKSRFSAAQVSVLLQQIAEKKEILHAKFSTELTNKRKKVCWASITDEVNNNNVDPLAPTRSVDEVKKKWNDLKSAVIRYRSDQVATGGGGTPKIPPYFDIIMDILGDKKALLFGITDTGCAPVPDCGWEPVEDSSYLRGLSTVLTSSPVAGPSSADAAQVMMIDMPFSPIVHTDTPTTDPDKITCASTLQNTDIALTISPAEHKYHQSTTKTTPSVSNINRTTLKRKSKINNSPNENTLWCEYLQEEIKTKKLQQDKIKEDIKLKKIMQEYYLKAIRKMDE